MGGFAMTCFKSDKFSPRRFGAAPLGSALRRYFGSGWAFLVPYLLAYLAYTLLKWPMVAAGASPAVPSLLHVTWALHALTLILGALAVAAWLGDPGRGPALETIAPWFFLGLLLFLPGAYLEFPSDPWEHLSRINSWGQVGATAQLYKGFAYFLPYSLVGEVRGSWGFLRLDLYDSAISLLLCWQYFKLAGAVGLGRRAALAFVFLQLLLLGNNTFGFYRYYATASTVFAQLGAVAALRIGIQATSPAGLSRVTGLSMVLLLLFTACSHVQGLGIAALALAAVAVWRVVEWRRAALGWLVAAAIVLSLAAIAWWPRDPAVDGYFRRAGWLSAWYGFDLWNPGSRAGERALQITGAFGILNLGAGMLLVCRNRLAGWLTVMPFLALSMPFVALPLANSLARYVMNPDAIVTFHRLLLSIPAGLALVCLAGEPFVGKWLAAARNHAWPGFDLLLQPSTAACLALLALTAVPANGPWYNRFWSVLVKPADDVSLRGFADDCARFSEAPAHPRDALCAVGSGLGFVLAASGDMRVLYAGRSRSVPSAELAYLRVILADSQAGKRFVAVVSRPTSLYSARSFAALCSGHWLPQEFIFPFFGGPEIKAMALDRGLSPAAIYREAVFYQDKPAAAEK